MVAVMRELKPKLTPDGNVLINLRTHMKNGVISDYDLLTRLALRKDGWKECERLIWYKPDAPPLGSFHRPRRTYEDIWWFSLTGKPYVNLHAAGEYTDRKGFFGSHRFRNGSNPIATKQITDKDFGKSRVSDVFTAPVTDIERGIQHPAMYPVSLCEKLIQTFSREGDVVLDPFMGSGTTLLAAQKLHRHGIGIERNPEYVAIAQARLRQQEAHAHTDDTDLRLSPEFPTTAMKRKNYLLKAGYEASDAKLFEYVLSHTLYASEPTRLTNLSTMDMQAGTGLGRSTVKRSLARLKAGGLIEHTPSWNPVTGSAIGPSESVVEAGKVNKRKRQCV